MLSFHVLSLEGRKRRGQKGHQDLLWERSRGTLRDYFGLRWTKKTATSVGGRGTYCIRLMCTQILITCPIRSECDTHSCSGTLSYDRFGMNRKRPTAYDGSGALFCMTGMSSPQRGKPYARPFGGRSDACPAAGSSLSFTQRAPSRWSRRRSRRGRNRTAAAP